jgi:hypothetical protein
MHAREHTHARAHMHKRTRTHACMHACTQTSTHVRAHTHARMHSQAHACTHAHTHIRMPACTHSSVLVQHFGQGDMLFYRLACVHMCVWHRTTGIALYLGPKSRQSSTESNSEFIFAREHYARYPACFPHPMPKFLWQVGVLADKAVEL